MENSKKISSPLELFGRAVDPSNFISTYILGHLWIERLLFHIIKIKTGKSERAIERLTHAKLIDLIDSLNILEPLQLKTLRKINQTRNKLAHDISYDFSITEFRSLVHLAQSAFSDMTDGFEQTLDELEGKANLNEVSDFVYPEIFMQIAYDLEAVYVELGGKIDSFK
ncbi:hypothetical protein H4J59_00040 [Colwellia sp. MB02u-10]|uniref:hypothetical protein n=1 Tax=Colwellia sp. MB02u-10 TaxID=2759828 RepID=UPI0015F518D1|nr:hypothetical protein [Colwellia sp. MB02u-10]MBA6339422.1 hypothetical protein [Colwellia sp. MB02u-10]